MSCYVNDLKVSISQAQHLAKDNPDDALRMLQQAARKFSVKTEDDKNLLCEAHCLIGQLHSKKSEDFLARDNFEKALKYASSEYQRGKIFLMLAEMETNAGTILKAHDALDRSLNLILGDHEAVGLHSCLLGVLATKSGDHKAAKEFYQEALYCSKDNRRKIISLILHHSSLIKKIKYWFWCRSIKCSVHNKSDQEKIPR